MPHTMMIPSDATVGRHVAGDHFKRPSDSRARSDLGRISRYALASILADSAPSTYVDALENDQVTTSEMASAAIRVYRMASGETGPGVRLNAAVNLRCPDTAVGMPDGTVLDLFGFSDAEWIVLSAAQYLGMGRRGAILWITDQAASCQGYYRTLTAMTGWVAASWFGLAEFVSTDASADTYPSRDGGE